jgi:hypothetical protein
MTDLHFRRINEFFVPGEGRRWRAVCKPCGWQSQKHRSADAANADFARHTTPPKVWAEPTDAELVGYGLHPSLVTGQEYGTDPRGRRRG